MNNRKETSGNKEKERKTRENRKKKICADPSLVLF